MHRLLHDLLAGAIDYAGLFPPASLDMPLAVREYARTAASPESWLLGRFIVPVARLAEFDTHAAGLMPASGQPWKLAVLPAADLADASRLIAQFNCAHAAEGAGRAIVDTVEFRATVAARLDADLRQLPAWLTPYVEVPLDATLERLLDIVAQRGARAKVRTGGITADAFPASSDLARFIAGCASRGLPFKATAGLHHPLRGEYRLTYDAGSASGTMYGFLNVFLAAAFSREGMDVPQLALLLEERDPGAFSFDDTHVTWNGERLALEAVRRSREAAIMGFGSCSFREPVDDLHALGWM